MQSTIDVGMHLPLALLPSQEKLREVLRDSRGCWYGTAPVDSATASSLACKAIDNESMDADGTEQQRNHGICRSPAVHVLGAGPMPPTSW